MLIFPGSRKVTSRISGAFFGLAGLAVVTVGPVMYFTGALNIPTFAHLLELLFFGCIMIGLGVLLVWHGPAMDL